MNALFAYCGLDCDSCPIRLATLEPNEDRKCSIRESIALKLKEIYETDFSAAQVSDCDGCRSGERLFNGCNNCPIRLCATKRKMESCAYCTDYCCDIDVNFTISGFIAMLSFSRSVKFPDLLLRENVI